MTTVPVLRDGEIIQVPAEEFVAPVPTLDERKSTLKDRIEAHGNAVRRQGFVWDFGTPEAPDPQVLQLREPGTQTPNNDDEKNWSASLSAYTPAVMLGQGAVQGATFRTESNATYLRTYQEGVLILTSMFAWVAAILGVVWTKKDAIEAASDHTALDVLEAEIEDGWP